MMSDETELVERAKALREACRKGVQERGVMPNYVDACVTLKALAPKLLDAIEALQRERDAMRAALEAVVAQEAVYDTEFMTNELEAQIRAALSGEAR